MTSAPAWENMSALGGTRTPNLLTVATGAPLLRSTGAAQRVRGYPPTAVVARMGCCTPLLYRMTVARELVWPLRPEAN